MSLNAKWRQILKKVDYTFQPLVNLRTGKTFAVEALLGNTEQTGFPMTEDFFHEAVKEEVLFAVDLELRQKAIQKFREIPFYEAIKLFYNYDPRILDMPDFHFGAAEDILNSFDLTPDCFCFELNEHYKFAKLHSFEQLFHLLKERGFKLALDDFGACFGGFELFYYAEPDYIKFDHFLIANIEKDFKKQTFCKYIVDLAKILGILVVAEGVETVAELETCKKIGFDLIQGFLIQRPTSIITELQPQYSEAIQNSDGEILPASTDFELIAREIIRLDTIGAAESIKVLFEKFHDNLRLNFFPVVDKSGFPLGIIHERDIKKYVYSPYGRDLLYNKSITNSLKKFLSACPICDINTPQEKILEVYINNPDSEGVIITNQQKYFGFLTAKSLLTIINEKNLSLAREINPLTKLPGNTMINHYIAEACQDRDSDYYLIYFDLNNFKPFNDRFGFTLGDQAITLLADLLKKVFHASHSFIGHIGGDDFFVGLKRSSASTNDEYEQIEKLVELFNQAARLFYTEKELLEGCYAAKDRNGKKKEFPLLSVSAAVLEMSPQSRALTAAEIPQKLAELKKSAKKSLQNIVVANCQDEPARFNFSIPG